MGNPNFRGYFFVIISYSRNARKLDARQKLVLQSKSQCTNHYNVVVVTVQACLELLEVGMKESLNEVVSKALRKLLTQPDTKYDDDIDNTLLKQLLAIYTPEHLIEQHNILSLLHDSNVVENELTVSVSLKHWLPVIFDSLLDLTFPGCTPPPRSGNMQHCINMF